MSSAVSLAVAVGLVFVNACFVAAEFAIVTVRRSRVETLARTGSRRAQTLQKILADLDAHISAGQLAITVSGLGIGWLGEPAVADLLAPAFTLAGLHSGAFLHTVSFTLAFALITATVLIVGEIAPKLLGLRRTELVALSMAVPVHGLARLTKPLLSTMNRIASGLLHAFGVGEADPEYTAMDSDEMRIFLSQSATFGRLSVTKRRMIENVIDFAEHTAKQIMIPRDQIDFLSLESSVEENLAIIGRTAHTRYPLCESGLDSVVGMIHLKDLFLRASTVQTSDDLRLIQHDMLFVPETQPIDVLQRTFQRRHAHMAIVVDEYGVPTGLVTLEDVLEELVGEIQDEFDLDEEPKIIHSPDGLLVDGMLLVDDLSRELEMTVPETEDDTIGGYVTTALGKIARVGDRFSLGKFEGRVVEMQGRRISRVLLVESTQPSE